MNNRRYEYNTGSMIVGIITMVLFFTAAYYIFKGISWILWFIAPVLIIATLIIDRKVFMDYFNWIGRLFRQNALFGIGAALLSVIGYQFVAVFLFGKAMLKKRVKEYSQQAETQRRGEFIEYTEVETITKHELPKRKETPPQTNGDDSYEQLFD